MPAVVWPLRRAVKQAAAVDNQDATYEVLLQTIKQPDGTPVGYAGSVYVLDVNHGTGRLLTASQANTDTISDTAYDLVTPIGPSGIAFLGEQGKLASAGKKRISDWSDDGTLTVSVAFGGGETSVTLTGYAPSAPTATARAGAVGTVQYDASQKRFTLPVMPSGGSATVQLHL